MSERFNSSENSNKFANMSDEELQAWYTTAEKGFQGIDQTRDQINTLRVSIQQELESRQSRANELSQQEALKALLDLMNFNSATPATPFAAPSVAAEQAATEPVTVMLPPQKYEESTYEEASQGPRQFTMLINGEPQHVDLDAEDYKDLTSQEIAILQSKSVDPALFGSVSASNEVATRPKSKLLKPPVEGVRNKLPRMNRRRVIGASVIAAIAVTGGSFMMKSSTDDPASDNPTASDSAAAAVKPIDLESSKVEISLADLGIEKCADETVDQPIFTANGNFSATTHWTIEKKGGEKEVLPPLVKDEGATAETPARDTAVRANEATLNYDVCVNDGQEEAALLAGADGVYTLNIDSLSAKVRLDDAAIESEGLPKELKLKEEYASPEATKAVVEASNYEENGILIVQNDVFKDNIVNTLHRTQNAEGQILNNELLKSLQTGIDARITDIGLADTSVKLGGTALSSYEAIGLRKEKWENTPMTMKNVVIDLAKPAEDKPEEKAEAKDQ